MGKSRDREEMNSVPIYNRELSWLSFNERVLQEAEDEEVPLIERMRFLGIYSNNLDEFFRVRVATVLRLGQLNKKEKESLKFSPDDLIIKINKKVKELQKRHINTFKSIVKELEREEIYLLNEKKLTTDQSDFVTNYFENKVRSLLVPIMLNKATNFPELQDEEVYFAIRLESKDEKKGVRYALIEIPSNLPRFVELPEVDGKKFVMFLDDIIRHELHRVFSLFEIKNVKAYAFKITRDAELDIEDDISTGLMEKMEASIAKRKHGNYVRFVLDQKTPEDLVVFLQKSLGFIEKDLFDEGGRYHNKKDFMSFPSLGKEKLNFIPCKPAEHPDFKNQNSLLNVILKKDVLAHFPYQDFNYTIDILREAAIDPNVKKIKINLYRVANNSKIINALVNAIKNGKKVTVSVELKARFDEENNINWASYLENEGAKIVFGVPGLKVHSKLILIQKKVKSKIVNIAHIGTGNFHEKTAKIYTDISLWTSNQNIAAEVDRLFNFFNQNYLRFVFRHIVVSPYSTRRKFSNLIDKEIKNAKAGKDAYIILKLNNLVDESMIKRLYDASNAGVKIKCIIRGICSLVPGVKGASENIEVISIIGRYLEHTRIIKFCNNNTPLYYISSADWMTRNIDNRVEVSTPIYDDKIKHTLDKILDFQFKDNAKARVINLTQNNKYLYENRGVYKAQVKTREYYKDIVK